MFIIRRIDQGGGYYAGPGRRKAYTKRRDCAHVFPTREAAAADLCEGNERIEEL